MEMGKADFNYSHGGTTRNRWNESSASKKEITNFENDTIHKSNENLMGKNIDEKSLETNVQNQIKNQLKSTNQIKIKPIDNLPKVKHSSKIEITSFQDLIDRANKEKEIELKYDLERNVKLVNFNKGAIDISFNEKLSKNFVKLLSEKLLLWTGERWIISLSKHTGEKTIYEKKIENNVNLIEEVKDNEEKKDAS